ncbi:hypothetical protein E2C01_060756 [Portunus trituberculatus]|uniref:Uncharacterized protein n=1 Tax=Portunus trituberculatus TaxID=210409 RepID=A0A5B7H9K4_PORTR|nr:hypothetical protein [Portunus trituberculatus]
MRDRLECDKGFKFCGFILVSFSFTLYDNKYINNSTRRVSVEIRDNHFVRSTSKGITAPEKASKSSLFAYTTRKAAGTMASKERYGRFSSSFKMRLVL